jgi:uncharacterized membrane protein
VTLANNAKRLADRFIPRGRKTRAAWLAALLVSIALLLLPFLFRLNGKTHAGWEQFLGRFHVLVVHLPIGFLVLLPLFEIVGIFRPALREAAGFVLGLGAAACLGSLALGYLLAWGGGEAGPTVMRHMWGAIALCIGTLLCLLMRPAWSSRADRHVYPSLLVLVLLALVWTAHQGGSLTHGSNYLSAYMPSSLRNVLAFGIVRAAPNPGSFYEKHIDPIFEANCVSCHGAGKIESSLRLDTYEGLMSGGKDGAVIAPGSAEKSLLLQRVTLPVDNKHFMPAEGHPPLRPTEIAWIHAWIQQGASPSAITLAGISLPVGPTELPLQPVGDYSALMSEIRATQNGVGAKLQPVSSKPSDGLVLSTVDVATRFGDAQLAPFQKFAPYIVEAELARTSVTDASFTTLAIFTHLRALHLEGTLVTGSGLSKLTSLSQLTYLNLSGTRVTSAALAPLASMKNLRRIYLFNTPAQPAGTETTQLTARSTQ